MERTYIEIPDCYEIDDEYDAHHIIYQDPNTQKKFMFKINIEDNDKDIGEEIGYRIAEMVGIPCCKAQLFKRKRMVTEDKVYYDYGVGSFFECVDKESVIIRVDVLKNLYWNEASNMYSELKGKIYFPTIEKLLLFFDYLITKNNRPKEEFEEIKYRIIEMIIYDVKFGNNDRIGSNFSIVEDKTTGKISLYPLFDNETILGFDYLIDAITGKETKSEIDEFNTLRRMKFPLNASDKNDSDYLEAFKYLLENYTEQTEKAMNKLRKFRFEDLRKSLNEYPNLSEKRKSFIEKVFLDRSYKIEKIYQEYIFEQRRKDGKEIVEKMD